MVEMVKVPHSHALNIDWLYESKNNSEINKKITDFLDETLTKDPPDLWLPIEWTTEDGIGGPPVEDPGTIYLTLPFESLDGVTWSTSLNALIDDVIENFCGKDGKIYNADGKEVCRRLMRHLRENAIKLELAMAEEAQLSTSGS